MKKKNHNRTRTKRHSLEDQRRPFADHLLELRRRLLAIAASVLLFSTGAYFIQQTIVRFLLRPAHNQQFIYTSPGGGIGFLFQVCTYVGIAFSMPVVIYNLLRFIEPVIGDKKRSTVVRYSLSSAGLAVLGFSFGYFVGLPAALHFLGHQFTTNEIHPLFTIQEYMSFVTVYLIGSAVLFQLPLIIIFINRIKPLRPKRLLNLERYVIAGAFIIAMIMAPTVNIFDQLIIAGPIIGMYQIAIVLIIFQNRSTRAAQGVQADEQEPFSQVAAPRAVQQLTDQTRPTRPRIIEDIRRPIRPYVKRPVIRQARRDFDFIHPVRDTA
jgi:sec-independent protein translocase protein TatC